MLVGLNILSRYSVKLLQSKLQEKLGPGVYISNIEATPRYISGKGILIEDPVSKLKLLEIDEIRFYPAIRSFFYTKSIVIKKIELYHPSFLIIRTRDSVWIMAGSTARRPQPEKAKPSTKITIDNVTIQDGKFVFIDHKNKSPPGEIQLLELESTIENIKYPFVNANRSPIKLKSKLFSEKDGTIDINGWILFKNFNVQLNASITNANLSSFEPYYKKNLGDLIEGGFFTVSSIIEIRDHILDVSGNLRLSRLGINKESSKRIIISPKTIYNIVKSQNNQINTKFHAKGDLKDPDFNVSKSIITSIIGNISKTSGISLGKKGGSFLKEKSKKGVDAVKKFFRRKKDK
jgi:hypothetical protein